MLADGRPNLRDSQFGGFLDNQVHFIAFDQGLGHRKKGWFLLMVLAAYDFSLNRRFVDRRNLGLVNSALTVKEFNGGASFQSEHHADMASLLIGNDCKVFPYLGGVNKETSH